VRSQRKDQAFHDTNIGPAEIQALEIIEILDQKNLETQPTTAGSELNEHRSLPDALVLGLPMKISSTPDPSAMDIPGLLERSVSAGGASLFSTLSLWSSYEISSMDPIT
jgi:hypothetical protein